MYTSHNYKQQGCKCSIWCVIVSVCHCLHSSHITADYQCLSQLHGIISVAEVWNWQHCARDDNSLSFFTPSGLHAMVVWLDATGASEAWNISRKLIWRNRSVSLKVYEMWKESWQSLWLSYMCSVLWWYWILLYKSY